ncbi:MAG TPA: serine/threonine-protein kinase [Vicinamibacteria bacterium]|nr:serine/threonine-protein kinase [Vicinamibacteria bacterium]
MAFGSLYSVASGCRASRSVKRSHEPLLASGDRLGPYRVDSSLGAGGMGEVYRAVDTRLGRAVAVKVLSGHRVRDPGRLQRFEEEARIVAGLSHANVLALHDVGSQDGVDYAVFELLDGQTLRQRLDSGPLPVSKVVDYGVQVCQGLAAVHARGIVHRDLKPDNIFLTRSGQLKILDFGLATLGPRGLGSFAGGSHARTPTEPGLLVGTCGYMAPEQARGRPADARSDIFAVGAVLYEMLSGRRAFAGPTPADTLAALLTQDPPEISVISRPVPRALDRVVRRCLERNPEERFQSARDVAFGLQAVFEVGVPSPLRPGRGLTLALALLALASTALLARRGA